MTETKKNTHEEDLEKYKKRQDKKIKRLQVLCKIAGMPKIVPDVKDNRLQEFIEAIDQIYAEFGKISDKGGNK